MAQRKQNPNPQHTSPSSSPKPQKPTWLKKYPVDVDWASDVETSTMVDMFESAVKKNGHKPCLKFMGRSWTFNEVNDMANRFAKGLQNQGVVKGTKVGLCLPNTPFYVAAYYGAMKAGATVVNFSPLYAEKEIEFQIKDSQCEVMVTVDIIDIQPKVEKALGKTDLKKIITCNIGDVLPPAKGIAYKAINTFKALKGKRATVKKIKDRRHISFNKMLKNKGDYTPVVISPSDVAVLQYTGGTTGVPKGAALSHANLTANLNQASLWFTGGDHMPKKEKMLAVLPFFHVLSMTVQMNLSISRGGELIMLSKLDLKQLMKTMHKEKPTMFAGVPAIYKAIIDHKDVGNYDLTSMVICLSGGAAMSEQVAKGWKALTGIDIVEGYGLSETSPLAVANPLHGDKKLNSIGLPVPLTEVRIMNTELPGKEQPINVAGEICLRGPQVMQGYWNKPNETAHVMDKDGFFHTGDVGYIDDEGYIFIVDRIKDMINSKGNKIFPQKLEAAILQHPDISDVMVIGVPDPKREEVPKAFIVMRDGKTIDRVTLNEFLKKHLSSYELITHVEFRKDLPKTMIGKPDRKALRADENAKNIKPAPKAVNTNIPPKPKM